MRNQRHLHPVIAVHSRVEPQLEGSRRGKVMLCLHHRVDRYDCSDDGRRDVSADSNREDETGTNSGRGGLNRCC